jgi:hypothetical protein
MAYSMTQNIISCVKNTRKTYSRYLEKTIIEVQVQFKDENPAWIPLDTLAALEGRIK